MSLRPITLLWSVAALAGLCLGTAPDARAAVDAAQEVGTAAQHAALAAAGTDLATVQMNLQQTINCLVGPKGKAFVAAAANPCQDQGRGAIRDTQDPAKKAALRQALAKARAGLRSKTMKAAQRDAQAAQAALKNSL